MSDFLKQTLYFSLIPIGIMLLLFMTGEGGPLVVPVLFWVLGGYFVGGLISLATGRKETGKALLLSCGILFLIGLSTCGLILLNFN